MATTEEKFLFTAEADTRELSEAQKDIDNLSGATEDAGDTAKRAGDKAEKGSDGIGLLGRAAKAARAALVGLAAVGFAGIIAGVGTAINDFRNMEAAMRRFEAQTGLTGDQLEYARDQIKDVFAQGWGDNLDDVAESMAKVNQVTDLTGAHLGYVTKQSLIFRQAFDKDVNESIRTAETLSRNFGIETATAFDVMTTAMQETGDPADDLLDTFTEYSSTFSDLRLDAADMTALLNAGLEAGARNTDVIADGLREFNIRLKEGESNAELLQLGLGDVKRQFDEGEISGDEFLTQVIDGLADVENEVERNRLGVELFGTQWEDNGEAIFMALKTAEGAARDMQGATADMGETLQRGAGPAWRRFQRTIRMTLLNVLGPFIGRGLNALTNGLIFLTAVIQGDAMPAVREFAEDAIGGAVDFLKEMIGALRDLSGADIEEAIAGFLDIEVGELRAIGDQIVSTLSAIWETAKRFGGPVVDAGTAALRELGGAVDAIGQFIGGIVTGDFDQVGEAIEDFGSSVATALGIFSVKTLETLEDALVEIAGLDPAGIRAVGVALATFAGIKLAMSLSALAPALQGVAGALMGVIGAPVLAALALAVGLYQAFSENLLDITDHFEGLTSAIAEGDVAGALEELGQVLWRLPLSIVLGIADAIGDLIGIDVEKGLEPYGALFEGIGKRIGQFFTDTVDELDEQKEKVESALEDVWSGAGDIVNEALEGAGSVKEKIIDFPGNVKSWLDGDAITDALTSPFTGIAGMVAAYIWDPDADGSLLNKIKNLPFRIGMALLGMLGNQGMTDALKMALLGPFTTIIGDVFTAVLGEDNADSLLAMVKAIPTVIEETLGILEDTLDTYLFGPFDSVLGAIEELFNQISLDIDWPSPPDWVMDLIGTGGKAKDWLVDKITFGQFATGGFLPGGEVGIIGDDGPEFVQAGPSGLRVMSNPASGAWLRDNALREPAPVGAGGGSIIYDYSNANFKFYGVQDIPGFYRALEQERERRNRRNIRRANGV